ncbi:sensor histidine kinase [Rhodanobacter sp. 7MK24]|uniref:sensor histidine kinase n=1 Tax=Rhodanobacter sp. 7MK24 TaxID=2775922 RepID=UPI0017834B77|nr:sensor histidine kinase [Rhodanobacter sp. 7MK24]MBD8879220.1 sensor histidine kinase [Rhodanobacter sp. 7MK24]
MSDMDHRSDHRQWPAWLHPAPGSAAAAMRAAGHSPWAYAWNLLWSFWVFLGPLFQHVGQGFWWSLVVGYPLFLLLFLLSWIRPTTEVSGYIGALVILTALSMPWNPAGWTYAVFACAMLPYEGSWLTNAIRMGVIQALLVLEGIFLHWDWYSFVILVGVCTSSGVGALVGRMNWDKNNKLRMSHEQIRQLAATAERERIGRDLHDLLGHTLSLITMKLELSRRLLDRDPETARRELAEAEEVARHALAEVRSAVTGIRAAGFAAELASATLLLRTSGVQLDQNLRAFNLPEPVECALALVLREAVTNIARHACATLARVSLTGTDGGLQLCIEDNGRGGIHTAGNGLRGMRERVLALGGTMRLDSPPGGGTRLDVQVPLVATIAAHAVSMPRVEAPVSACMRHAT